MQFIYKGKPRTVIQVDEGGQGFMLDVDGKSEWIMAESLTEPQRKPLDNVNPDHYKIGGIQPYEYMKAKFTKEMYEGFLLGNIIKYTSRYHHKNGTEDLKKAQWYMNELLHTLEG